MHNKSWLPNGRNGSKAAGPVTVESGRSEASVLMGVYHTFR